MNTVVYPIVKDAAAFLRIGSLNVKVRKTTEAFNSLLSRDVDAKLHRAWGSSDSLPDAVRFQGKCEYVEDRVLKINRTVKPYILYFFLIDTDFFQ